MNVFFKHAIKPSLRLVLVGSAIVASGVSFGGCIEVCEDEASTEYFKCEARASTALEQCNSNGFDNSCYEGYIAEIQACDTDYYSDVNVCYQ